MASRPEAIVDRTKAQSTQEADPHPHRGEVALEGFGNLCNHV
jgi:hypothetical protein